MHVGSATGSGPGSGFETIWKVGNGSEKKIFRIYNTAWYVRYLCTNIVSRWVPVSAAVTKYQVTEQNTHTFFMQDRYRKKHRVPVLCILNGKWPSKRNKMRDCTNKKLKVKNLSYHCKAGRLPFFRNINKKILLPAAPDPQPTPGCDLRRV